MVPEMTSYIMVIIHIGHTSKSGMLLMNESLFSFPSVNTIYKRVHCGELENKYFTTFHIYTIHGIFFRAYPGIYAHICAIYVTSIKHVDRSTVHTFAHNIYLYSVLCIHSCGNMKITHTKLFKIKSYPLEKFWADRKFNAL